MGYECTDDHSTLWLPFGYNLDHDADLLMLRRSDGSLVAAFYASGADLFEIYLVAWQDADLGRARTVR